MVTSRFPGGELWLGRNTWYDATSVTVADESLTEPVVHATLSLADGTVTDDHRDEAPGHDPTAYVTEVRAFPSADGTPVPATIVRHRDTPLDGTAPALLFGYGAYEYAWEREWEEPLPSFLDRGVVFVRTHIRGGGEGGRRWWLDGCLHAKQHTFDDQVAVADGLAAEGLVDPDRIVTRGLSAGGLLSGAVFSQRPDRWRAVVAEVPFVDVVTTMFDDSVPLTVNEWEEWGDPRDRADFDAMLAYSPYDNPPPAGVRPDLLVTGAVHDTRVLVREPAKWVAMLRETDPEWSPRCLFRAELGTGSHVGPSGRLGHLAYEADVAAWILDRMGLSGEGYGHHHAHPPVPALRPAGHGRSHDRGVRPVLRAELPRAWFRPTSTSTSTDAGPTTTGSPSRSCTTQSMGSTWPSQSRTMVTWPPMSVGTSTESIGTVRSIRWRCGNPLVAAVSDGLSVSTRSAPCVSMTWRSSRSGPAATGSMLQQGRCTNHWASTRSRSCTTYAPLERRSGLR